MAHRKEELIESCITVGRRMSWNMFHDEVELIPGVKKLFSVVGHRNIAIAVVTSTERSNIERKLMPLARNGIKETLSAVIAIEDAPRRKPAPDPLIVCARQLSVAPRNCLYVGDSRVDIQAGRDAGMLTIGVLTGLDDRKTLERESPTLILDSVADLIPFFS
jgi:beta-phosphoglucomutase-like phosphatase (HAD superfamily)